jgi:uncharacterized protein involved in propanediol utilization
LSGYYGRAEAIGHAGEILQGAVCILNRVEPFLVTLPAPNFRSEATICTSDTWSVHPSWKTKALTAAQLACQKWGSASVLRIEVNSHMPIARGCGSSTADCVAVVRAVAAMISRPCSPEEIARIVQQAETASDSTMFDLEPIAFLPRSGKVLHHFDAKWPAMNISVVDLGGPDVETLDSPIPNYTESELDEFYWLLQELGRALQQGDAEALGRVATRSAIIHQHHRPHPDFQNFLEKAKAAGAYGVALAHSGSIAAVLSPKDLYIQGSIAYVIEGAQHANLASRRR